MSSQRPYFLGRSRSNELLTAEEERNLGRDIEKERSTLLNFIFDYNRASKNHTFISAIEEKCEERQKFACFLGVCFCVCVTCCHMEGGKRKGN